jgi:hypothetical protein
MEQLTKDLRCFEPGAYSELDFLVSSRESGGYELMAQWSQHVSSDDIIKKRFPMESAIQYVILLSTESSADATAIEIRDSRGEKQEYEYKVSDLDRQQINLFYTPDYDDVYQISFRTINSHRARSCMYMAIMKGDKDPFEY